MSRSSSSEMASRDAVGSPPKTRTRTSVDRDSSQITGRDILASRSRDGAAKSENASARCSARRFGASSLTTRDR